MLPIKLRMSAFCSYLNETEIDFSQFGRKGLYLITGDTGAGKTTIFDAISYALYGEASGDLREPKLFRSKNAKPDVPTFVELTFSSKGKTYCVRRSPEYERPAKRGEGTVKSPAEAVLTVFDGEEKHTRTLRKNDGQMDDIIGIDSKKFKQLSMIAQGAFMRVLNADTAEKTEILRAIFNTEKFSMLQDELKSMAEQSRDDYNRLSDSILARLYQASCSEDGEYREEMEALRDMNRDFVASAPRFMEVLELVIEEDTLLQQNVKSTSAKLLQEQAKKQSEIGSAKEREKTRKIYLETKARADSARSRLPELIKAAEAVSGSEEKASALEGQIHSLRQKQPEYKRLEQLTEEYKTTASEIARQLEAAEQKEKQLAETRRQTEEMKREREALAGCEVELEKTRTEKDKYSAEIITLREFYSAIVRYEKSADNYRKEQEMYVAAKQDADRLQREYQRLNTAFLDEQAGIIASTLLPGQPCPVCGSTEHPCLAPVREGAPTREQVKQAEQSAQKGAQKASDVSSRCSSAGAACREQLESINETTKKLFGSELSVEDSKAAAAKNGKELKEKLETAEARTALLEKQSQRRKQIDDRLPGMEEKTETLRDGAEKLRTSAEVLKEKQQGISGQISRLGSELPFPTERELVLRMTELTKQKEILLGAFRAAEKNLRECRSTIEAQEEALRDFGEINTEPEDEKLLALEQEAALLGRRIDEESRRSADISRRREDNKSILEYLKKTVPRLDELKERYIQCAEISATANGRLTGGKEKMTLEVFAQARYFDSILSLANLRLKEMSNGKYEFRRSEQALEKRGRSGLDIDVIDHDSATRRSVKSLSGGESFMASLSLALGFSDVIQSTVGGVQLETMFIDEGFGTLDERSLEKAYRVFADLSTNGSCLVGIISHVEDLKTRIPNRINVAKDISGNSTAKALTSFAN